MKIALLGYGRMGKTIASYAQQRNHKIVYILDKEQEEGSLSEADVAINFSVPEAAVSNIKAALEQKIPVVSGTTGWLEKYEEVVTFCKTQQSAFLYASNFSIGVNLFFKINQFVAQLMHPHQSAYQTEIQEIHHIHKLDAPSGTAITIAEGIIKETDYTGWELDNASQGTLPIEALREGEVPGTHTVHYRSEIDQISIKHEAYKRDGFALGAVIAAEWLAGKEGIFSMDDVLKIS
ncbi:MAG: 4-hydroxy-tetrahydrodipicolinate reductase [Flavobacteriaceae bacterium]|jgi:4-hydroxy-tetrahydrodipicolinate reductase|nr:4-hydroxy-tetrahydrodipicolinate reductase [Flavobacteriaceae bacterium]MDG1920971.1 4-hydroxy-tetrahydrodipicolinate reductase [Flavobacteriaceae bacterium]